MVNSLVQNIQKYKNKSSKTTCEELKVLTPMSCVEEVYSEVSMLASLGPDNLFLPAVWSSCASGVNTSTSPLVVRLASQLTELTS